MGLIATSRAWANRLKREALTLWFAKAHPATPWYAKVLGGVVLAYALSPIDLIPDFIPVLGYLDDVILLPILIWFAVRLVPHEVLIHARLQAEQWISEQRTKPQSWIGGAVIVSTWLVGAALLSIWVFNSLDRNST